MLAASAAGCAYQIRTAVSVETTMWRLTGLIGSSVSWAPTDLQRAHVKLRLARFDAMSHGTRAGTLPCTERLVEEVAGPSCVTLFSRRGDERALSVR
jgi:hypothetical protein